MPNFPALDDKVEADLVAFDRGEKKIVTAIDNALVEETMAKAVEWFEKHEGRMNSDEWGKYNNMINRVKTTNNTWRKARGMEPWSPWDASFGEAAIGHA